MKPNVMYLSICFMLLFISCKDEAIEPVDLTSAVMGDWNSQEVYVNGNLQEEGYGRSIWLGLREDNFFFKNYVNGKWSTNNRTISVYPRDDSGFQQFQYEIVNVTDSTLTLKRTLTAREYLGVLDNIEKDELFTVVEKYKRFK